MAIVINGSGTVTGISVGGLPDGIVDSGTLATNSVDSAELVDGAVDDSHMAAMAASKLTGALPAISGASLTGLTTAQMPTGTVLKVERSATAGTSSTTSTSLTEILTHNYTPVSSNSKIYVQVFMVAYNANTNTTAGLLASVKRAGVLIGIDEVNCVYTSTTADRFSASVVITGEYTNSATDAADYELWIKSYDGASVSAYSPYMIITEVAG